MQTEPTGQATVEFGVSEVRVRVRGELDLTGDDQLQACLDRALTSTPITPVLVDLHDCTYLDSLGLGALVVGYRAALEQQRGFKVAGANGIVRRVFEITNLVEVFGLDG